jgi:ABC-type phosphate transport system auxiliary subunit
MTENLNTLIEDIRTRSLQIAAELKAERAQHDVHQGELRRIQELYQAEHAKVTQLETTIEELNVSLAEAQNKVVEVPVATTSRNAEEIDALVKEIEFCIEKLKQA